MANTVSVEDDGFIHTAFEGDQTYDSVKKTAEETAQYIKRFQEENKKVLILVDLTKLGKTHSDARKIGLEIMRELQYDKVALFGRDLFTKYLVNFIVKATEKEEKTRYFFSESEAKTWLIQ